VVVDLNVDNVREAMTEASRLASETSQATRCSSLRLQRARNCSSRSTTGCRGATIRSARRAARPASGAQFASDMAILLKAGASDVVAAEAEAAAEITTRILESHGVPATLRSDIVRRIRARSAGTPEEERDAHAHA
jgi:hypothetical protein